MKDFIERIIADEKVLVNTKYYTGNRYDAGLICTFKFNFDNTGTFTEEWDGGENKWSGPETRIFNFRWRCSADRFIFLKEEKTGNTWMLTFRSDGHDGKCYFEDSSGLKYYAAQPNTKLRMGCWKE